MANSAAASLPAASALEGALPIDEVTLPEEDVSDLHEVVDAINRLCDTMTSSRDEDAWHECAEAAPPAPPPRVCRVFPAVPPPDAEEAHVAHVARVVECAPDELVQPEEVVVRQVETFAAPSPAASPPHVSEGSDSQCERPPSELYYTASSEVSLVSDVDLPESPATLVPATATATVRSECVMAGHVAAMRERFENMTRTNTPCPGTERTGSPLPDTPSPDCLG